MGPAKRENQKIIFFDGLCHLCDGFVQFVIRHEKVEKTFVFAPLQGSSAALYLSPEQKDRRDSILLWEEGALSEESTAVLRIFSHLQLPWRWLAQIASGLPRPVLNHLYRWVARHRYRLFGRRDSCRLPRPEEKDQFWP